MKMKKRITVKLTAEIDVDVSAWPEWYSDEDIIELEEQQYQEWVLEHIKSEEITVQNI
jgi:hypothetical protein